MEIRLEEKSTVEKASGSLITGVSLTLLAAAASTANPTAALLPLLTNSLASKRHEKRVEQAIESLENEFRAIEEKVASMSDPQYKFISELVLSIIHSPDDEKISYLKNAIKSTITIDSMKMHDAVVLSRILRDISVLELQFLLKNVGSVICTDDKPRENEVAIDKSIGLNSVIISGLQGQALLTTIQGMVFGVENRYYFTPLAERIAKVFKNSEESSNLT